MELKDIKASLTLSSVLHHYGLKPDKNLRLNCPFHEDKTPSLQVTTKHIQRIVLAAIAKPTAKALM